ncbi:hypothetical protein ONZ45_g17236 [Pleurotus djamor]|nr:hypothetical protein ONZ45_g17236 [Pleurotus djamor]
MGSKSTTRGVFKVDIAMKLVIVALLFAPSLLAKPANDWSKPCFNGECAYDMPASSGSSGVLQMRGDGITDITPAAGWIVLDCDPHTLDQEIRLVCSSTNHEEAGCNHLFDKGGAEHKVVRLPESCTSAPFMRIAESKVAENQVLPQHASNKIRKRDGKPPTVYTLRVDREWGLSDASKVGEVAFSFTGVNSPDVDVNPYDQSQPPSQLRRRASDGFFSWVGKAFNSIKDYVVKAANAVVHTLKGGVTVFLESYVDVNGETLELTHFKINPELVKDIHLDTKGKSMVLFKTDKRTAPTNCRAASVNLEVLASGKVDAQMRLGLTANGSVVPPILGSWAVYAIFDGNVDAHVKIDATVIGQLTTDRVKVVEVPASPITIPGVLTLGPFVRLEAQADLDLSLEVQIDAHLKYKVDKLEFWYPRKLTQENPDAKSRAQAIQTQESPFEISAEANIAAQANLTAHLIPSLHLGVSVFSGKASASAYVEVDVWARLHLRGDVSASASNHRRDTNRLDANQTELTYVPPYLGARAVQTPDAASAEFKGCIGAYVGAVIRAGAKGEIASMKGETPTWEIYKSPELEIIRKCWGGATKRSIASYTSAPSTTLERRAGKTALKCGKHGAKKQLGTEKGTPKKLK